MRQFDKPDRPAAPSLLRLADFGRLSGLDRLRDPTTLVCAALALAVVMLSIRIVSIW